MPFLFKTRTRKIFGVLSQIQDVFGYYAFRKEEDIYSVSVRSIDNDNEMAIYIYVYFSPEHHVVISQDQLAVFDDDFDNSLVLEEWCEGRIMDRRRSRHASNDKNFAFLLYTCEHWVMIEKRNKKRLAQDQMMKTIRKKLEKYFKAWI